jgi:hypothetical protein
MTNRVILSRTRLYIYMNRFQNDRIKSVIPMCMISFQLIPKNPRAQSEKPIVAPTTLCVVETGNSKNVARSNQEAQPSHKFII